MARLEVLKPSVDGTILRNNTQEDGATAATWASAADMNKYPNSGKELLQIAKGGTDATMTITSRALDPYGDARDDKEVTIAENTTKLYGPFNPGEHNERSGSDKDYTEIGFSDDTGLEVTVIRA